MCPMLAMYDMEDEEQSVTDTSEDSIDVRVKTISNPPSAKKNKRKSLEPKRLTTESDNGTIKRCRLNSTGSEERSPVGHSNESRSPSPGSPSPAKLSSPKRRSTSPMCLAPKKRFKFDALKDLEEAKSESVAEDTKSKCPSSPFRPWSESKVTPVPCTPTLPPVPYIPFLLGGMDPTRLPILPIDPRLYPSLPIDPRLLPPYMPMPTSPDAKSLATSSLLSSPISPASGYSLSPSHPHTPSLYPPEQDEPLSLVKKNKSRDQDDETLDLSRPTHHTPTKPRESHTISHHTPISHTPTKPRQQVNSKRPGVYNVEMLMGHISASKPHQVTPPLPPTSDDRLRNDSGSTSSGEERSKQRNYKNMTRERRVEANARERQRVHTITAAFDNLQGAIPQDDENSKLSKLSVIKIATAYIMALSRMAGHDYTEDQSAPPVEEVIRHCSEVIEEEQRQKKRSTS